MSYESDTGWANLHEPWERLRWARSRREEFSTQEAFASAVGVKRGAYRLYEADPAAGKSTALKYEQAVHWARRLKVRWEWLLRGEGLPFPDVTRTPGDEAREIVDSQSPEEAERLVAAIRILARTGTDN